MSVNNGIGQVNPNMGWRSYYKRTPIIPCKLQLQDLKLLYRIIDQKQRDYYNSKVAPYLSKQTNETDQQFTERQKKVSDAFITTIAFTDESGETIMGHGEDFFDNPMLPVKIQSIVYDTTFSPNAQIQLTPNDRVSVLLDFSRPSLLNISGKPSDPTPNESNYIIFANDEPWRASLKIKLEEFFKNRARAVPIQHLHGQGTYDVLLLILGLPACLWTAYYLGEKFLLSKLPLGITTGLYIYVFLLSLIAVKAMFSYSRWLFPRVEMEGQNSSSILHKSIWALTMVALWGNFIYDLAKTFVLSS